MKPITLEDYFAQMCRVEVVEDAIVAAARDLLVRVNLALSACPLPEAQNPIVSSGFRTPSYNSGLAQRGYNPAVNSKHMKGQAIDVSDPEGLIDEWFQKTMPAQAVAWEAERKALQEIEDQRAVADEGREGAVPRRVIPMQGVWIEHPLATKGWCHMQSVPPGSEKRIFIP